MNPDPDLTLSTKSNSKWITGLNVKPKIIKRLEDNIRENLDDLKYGSDFLDKTAKLWSVKKKKKTIKLDFTKIQQVLWEKQSEDVEKDKPQTRKRDL